MNKTQADGGLQANCLLVMQSFFVYSVQKRLFNFVQYFKKMVALNT